MSWSSFNNLTSEQLEKFNLAIKLYTSWNKKINLISRKDSTHLMTRHMLHSLGIAKVIKFLPKAQVIDVGTGGGFPGIPLAICFPKTQFLLVDSIKKKIQVVQNISKALELNNVTPLRSRVEDVDGLYDFVVSRAVTSMPKFIKWVAPLVSSESNHQMKNGILYLKGGDLSEEMNGFKNYEEFNLSTYFSNEFFDTKKVLYVSHKYFPKN